MAFLSKLQSQAQSSLLLKMSSKNIVLPMLALSAVSILSIFPNSIALANSCSKSDIDYYLKRGFTNAQVVQLCAGPAQTSGQQTQTYQAPAVQTQQYQQQNQAREDESYFNAALNAENVVINNEIISVLSEECIKHGPDSGSQAAADLIEKICVGTKININFSGMVVGKASKGFFLVKDPSVNIKGNIQRDLIGLNQLRRQDREIITEKLSKSPTSVSLKIRRGIDPSNVALRLRKYAK